MMVHRLENEQQAAVYRLKEGPIASDWSAGRRWGFGRWLKVGIGFYPALKGRGAWVHGYLFFEKS